MGPVRTALAAKLNPQDKGYVQLETHVIRQLRRPDGGRQKNVDDTQAIKGGKAS